MKDKNIIIYTTIGCGECYIVKQYLKQKGINYEELIVEKDITIEDFFSTYGEIMHMPLITMKGNKITFPMLREEIENE